MIQVSNLEKSYGSQILFSGAGFVAGDTERVGLVGRNGSGKSTLFRMLLGLEEPDSGQISISAGASIGYLAQHVSFSRRTVLEEAADSIRDAEDTYRAEAILQGLGFARETFQVSPSLLPGGFQVRLMLARVLAAEPTVLLLDEPTNYLDIVSIRWLTRFLRNWRNQLLLITHDRTFMDSVTTHTMAIHRRQIKKIEGGTDKLFEQILSEEEVYEKTRLNEDRKREQLERFINRFRAQASRAKAVQSKIKALERHQPLEALAQEQDLDFHFQSEPFEGKWLLHVREAGHAYGAAAPLFRGVSFSIGKKDRIGVIGPNGKGKTTLLSAIAGELQLQEGSVEIHEKCRAGYFGQTNVQRLNESATIEEEIWSVDPSRPKTSVRSICGAMMFEGDAALKAIRVLSGGERSRVLLGKILMMRTNLLLLDEPNNHLDMESIDSLIEALEQFEGAVIFVSHSDRILNALATRLIVFDRGEANLFEGTYADFLERIGWSEEGEIKQKPDDTDSISRKDMRKLRAELVQRRSSELRELRARVQKIEDEVVKWEEEQKRAQDRLLELANAGGSAEMGELSKTLHRANFEIERLFEELAEASNELSAREAEFDQQLAAIEE